jgi:hypothetical protein
MSKLAETQRADTPEEEKVEEWRLAELLRVGYSIDDAISIAARHSGADAIDLHNACDLIEKGADPQVAADILL